MKAATETRIRTLHRHQMSAEQRRVHDAIAAGPRGGVPGPLAVWLHSPQLAETAQRLGQFVRYDSALPPRLSELAILLVGRYWTAHYEWWVHRPIAEDAGLAGNIVDAIRDRRTPPFQRTDERIVYDFVQQLQRQRRVEDDVYHQALAALGEQGVVDLVGICGYYTLIAMTLNTFQVPLPDGAASDLDDAGDGLAG